jgi:hypothetical protein
MDDEVSGVSSGAVREAPEEDINGKVRLNGCSIANCCYLDSCLTAPWSPCDSGTGLAVTEG